MKSSNFTFSPLGIEPPRNSSCSTVGQIKQPVLIIHGKKDRYVRYGDANKLEETLKLNGNSQVTFKVLEGYDHTLLKVDQEGRIYIGEDP